MTCILTQLFVAGYFYVVPFCYEEPVYTVVDAEIAAWVG